MALYKGNEKINGAYFGNNKILKISYGNNVVFSKTLDLSITVNSTVVKARESYTCIITLSNGYKFGTTGKITLDSGNISIGTQTINSNGQLQFNVTGVNIGTTKLIFSGFKTKNLIDLNITNSITIKTFDYVIEKLTSSGTWIKPAGVTHIDIAVAGGGGAGYKSSTRTATIPPTAGAGGLIYIENYDVTKYGNSIPYTIGAGGVGRKYFPNSYTAQGENSSFGNLVALGGGAVLAGGGYGAGGGSGGGGKNRDGGNSTQATTNDGYPNSGFGNAGGRNVSSNDGFGGGGGGAGGPGNGRYGGAGKFCPVFGVTLCEAYSSFASGNYGEILNSGHGGGVGDYYAPDIYSNYSGGSGVIYIRYKI